ncbi:MAG: hypothetical protein J6M92_06575, partial [Oribacterium sp.]|nr:hypothetical protein [Oribacterium sp.]
KKLRAAKTKEDAQRVIADEANASLSKVNAVVNNPHISEGDKMAVCVAEYRKLVKKQEIFAKFEEKGEYSRLPTDAEKRKAEKEIREAKEEELKNAGRKTYDTEENGSENKSDPAIHEKDVLSVDTVLSSEKTVSSDGTRKVYKSSTQAENTPEALKVKRSRSNSGRNRLYRQDEDSSSVATRVWNA